MKVAIHNSSGSFCNRWIEYCKQKNIDYKVVSFQIDFPDAMGGFIPEKSNGSQFSERQKSKIRSLQHGKRFYISHVKATGPDGITRDISPIEVIVN